jgi:hypothetical protein
VAPASRGTRRAAGSNLIKKEVWKGKQVVLYLGEYEYDREKKLGIRLKLPGAPSRTLTGAAAAFGQPKAARKAADDIGCNFITSET